MNKYVNLQQNFQKIRGHRSLFFKPCHQHTVLIVNVMIELRATLPLGSLEEITGKLKLCLLFKYKDLFSQLTEFIPINAVRMCFFIYSQINQRTLRLQEK